jgi:YegS/Rv2252/BmrU family lipid kinase
MGNKLLFIINKYSGKGYQPQVEGKILNACARHDIECTLEFTRGPGHAQTLAQQACGAYQAVVAVGGDGTVNEVARALVNTPTPLGIIPKGSGNGLARHLGIPMNYMAAIESLFTSTPITIDTFTLNGKLGVNVAGVGFDGHIANLFATGKVRGLWGYTRLVIREFFRFQGTQTITVADGNTYTSHDFILAIANASQYGNNACIAPQASVTDQLLNLVHIGKIPVAAVPQLVFRMFSRSLKNNTYCTTQVCRAALIKLPHPVPFHIDGEPCGATDSMSLHIQPASLRVLVPAQTASKI